MYLRRDVSSQVKEMFASGEIRQEVEFAYEVLTENADDLSRDPFADSLSYSLAMRSANPGRDSVWWAKSVGDRESRRPLSDDQVAAWRETVLTLPTGLRGYFGLVENLIGSGRREGALELVGRIEVILARIPQEFVPVVLAGNADELARLTEAARELREPDGLARSLTVIVVGEEGLPVQGVPVGVYQVFGIDRIVWLGRNRGVTASPLPHSPEGVYATTDAAGEVRFSGLKGVAYGVTVITGWPGSGMEGMRFVAPRDPIPEVLPPGESIVRWQVLSPGHYTMVGRQAVFDPPVSDSLVLEALCMTIGGGNGCPMDVRPDRLYDTWFESAGRTPKNVYFVGFSASGVAKAIWVNAPNPDPAEGE
ncbi:hypothetical protein IIA16_01815 [bacterium]|nr:hypothetical protein [bacterium]